MRERERCEDGQGERNEWGKVDKRERKRGRLAREDVVKSIRRRS